MTATLTHRHAGHVAADVDDGIDGEEGRDEVIPMSRRIGSYTLTIAVVLFTIYLWPAMLGGSSRLVIVSGTSMEPTYDLLDMVVARDAGDTQIGDVVVFAVPEGQGAGSLVIHRVVEIDDEGFFITQGDNRDTPDQWQLTEEDIVGKPLLHIPEAGKALGFIQNIWVVALLVGAVALFLLWPDEDDENDEDGELDGEQAAAGIRVVTFAADARSTTRRTGAAPVEDEPSPDELARIWLEGELASDAKDDLGDDVMADAAAWLDEQLADLGHPSVR